MTIKGEDWLGLPEGYAFGIVETDEEFEELVGLIEVVDQAGEFFCRFSNYYPYFCRSDMYYISDEKTGKMVSTLSAVPSTWSYGEITLRNLEVGFVGTLKEHRQQGLIRVLYRYFERRMKEDGYDISTIQGIPYFYRQFGYDFILPLHRKVVLRPDQLPTYSPEQLGHSAHLEIRKATSEDIGSLMRLYSDLTSRLLVSSSRSEELWTAQERLGFVEELPFTTYVIDNGGTVEGYFRLSFIRDKDKPEWVHTISVVESSVPEYSAVQRAFTFLRDLIREHQSSSLILPGTKTCNLSRIGLACSGQIDEGWRWQIRVPNMLQFLIRIVPVLERRLAQSIYAKSSFELFINTFKHCYMMIVVQGKIIDIQDLGLKYYQEFPECRFPPHDFVRLVLGQSTIDELKSYNIDVTVSGKVKDLVETLFPKEESYIEYYQL